MKFATTLTPQGPRACVVDGDWLALLEQTTSVLDLVRLGRTEAIEAGERAIAGKDFQPLEASTLLSPIQPPAVRDFLTFAEHVESVRRGIDGTAGVPVEWYEAPTFYFSNPHTLIGPGAAVPVPGGSRALDFELEVAAVAGQDCSDLTPDQAEAAMFGYTIFNDWSARDLQYREMRVGLGPAKGKDFASTLGPWIVTADELTQYQDDEGFLNLRLQALVNGVVVGEDVLSNMGWTFPALLIYASRDSRVAAGDILASGTCGNGGCLAELWGRNGAMTPPPLVPGDVVTLVVEGIGSVSNTVVAGNASTPIEKAMLRDPSRERARRLSEARDA